jgi:hypothetical protein
MDIIQQHFAAESAHDVPATLATYTDDVVWDNVGSPACPVHGKSGLLMDHGIALVSQTLVGCSGVDC